MTPGNRGIARSLIFQILLAMTLITTMALASMTLSVYVTMSTQDDAEAINLAGSLRMQSYRISNIFSQTIVGAIDNPQAQLKQEKIVFSEKMYRSNIPITVSRAGNVPLEKSYAAVVENWQQSIEPLLNTAIAGEISWEDANNRYTGLLDDYVADVEFMVTHLQRETESKIELLGMSEAISIILIIFTVIYLVMKADENFATPLRALVRAAKQVEKGNFSHRISYSSSNELGLLSHTFNGMTESLESQYRTLEDQVAARTEQLRRSNQVLHFLHKTSREIASSPYDQKLLKVFLGDLKKVADVELINLCASAEPNYLNYDIISTEANQDENCVGNCGECSLAPSQVAILGDPGVSLPIANRSEVYGFLYIRCKAGTRLEPWQSQLFHTVTETLSTSFAFHRTLGQERRLILLEERSTIARELHDSLAQSLSYMKMETTRLKKLLAGNYEANTVTEAIDDLQEGINAAYKHLRELLVTFRIKLDAPDLRSALEQAVMEFDEQGSAQVSLDYALEGYGLGANDDIHVLHILREALNNSVKHAQATNITVSCSRDEDGDVLFHVDDDGIGIPETPEKVHHYGLYNMRERAQRLNGSLTWQRRDPTGTRVQLRVPAVSELLRA